MIKFYPAGYHRFVVSLFIYSGPRKRIRNVSVSMEHDSGTWATITEQIGDFCRLLEAKTKGVVLSVRSSLGRYIEDASSTPGTELEKERAGLCLYQNVSAPKHKQFVVLPWLRSGIDPTEDSDIETLGTDYNLATLAKVFGDITNPDQIKTTLFNKMSKAVKMDTAREVAEIGDDESSNTDGLMP